MKVKHIWNLAMWRKAILERDNYQCQDCGLPHLDYFLIPSKLRPMFEAHHIIPIKESLQLIFDLQNGVTLCHFCHRARHFDIRKNEQLNA